MREWYREDNPTCELSRWLRRNWRNGFTDSELRDQSAEVNHIFSMGSRPDLWSNLITLSATVHRFFHANPIEGRILCLYRKLRKSELDLGEIRIASGKRLEGYLLSKPTDNPWLKPCFDELLAFAERE